MKTLNEKKQTREQRDEQRRKVLEQLNKSMLETRKISELETYPAKYDIVKVDRIATKFGPSLVAELEKEDSHFKVFLPKRYEAKISDEDLPVLVDIMKMTLVGGKFNELKFE